MAVDRYQGQSDLYYANALRFLREGDAQKAAEFLWGSVAEVIKAIAASRGRRLRSHRDIAGYTRELARELGDDDVWHGYREANALHTDFYEAGLTVRDVRFALDMSIRPTLDRLVGLLS
jgi:hypothetical protein